MNTILYPHLYPMAARDVEVVKGLDKAKAKYQRGEEGPFEMQGSYTLQEYQDVAELTSTETTPWQPEYSEDDGMISIYGDPAPIHAMLVLFVTAAIWNALLDHLVRAPASDVAALDDPDREAALRALLSGNGDTSGMVGLSPMQGDQHTIYPGYRISSQNPPKNDGIIYKMPDALFQIERYFTLSGNPELLCFFEAAYRNETTPVLVWEALRSWEAGTPVTIAASINVELYSSFVFLFLFLLFFGLGSDFFSFLSSFLFS
jgi:hypothetical protein